MFADTTPPLLLPIDNVPPVANLDKRTPTMSEKFVDKKAELGFTPMKIFESTNVHPNHFLL